MASGPPFSSANEATSATLEQHRPPPPPPQGIYHIKLVQFDFDSTIGRNGNDKLLYLELIQEFLSDNIKVLVISNTLNGVDIKNTLNASFRDKNSNSDNLMTHYAKDDADIYSHEKTKNILKEERFLISNANKKTDGVILCFNGFDNSESQRKAKPESDIMAIKNLGLKIYEYLMRIAEFNYMCEVNLMISNDYNEPRSIAERIAKMTVHEIKKQSLKEFVELIVLYIVDRPLKIGEDQIIEPQIIYPTLVKEIVKTNISLRIFLPEKTNKKFEDTITSLKKEYEKPDKVSFFTHDKTIKETVLQSKRSNMKDKSIVLIDYIDDTINQKTREKNTNYKSVLLKEYNFEKKELVTPAANDAFSIAKTFAKQIVEFIKNFEFKLTKEVKNKK